MSARRIPCAIRRGFTLIELLVVVAILGLLSAVALPNLLEAQTRAKVSRTRSDLRTLGEALEAYHVDHSAHPPSSGVGEPNGGLGFANPVSRRLIPLTTPIAHLASIPVDPFPARSRALYADTWPYDTYDYVSAINPTGAGSGATSGGAWRISGAGPDGLQAFGGRPAFDGARHSEAGVDYDPTNGTVSAGDLVRVGSVAPTANGRAPDDLTNPLRPGILRAPVYREQFR